MAFSKFKKVYYQSKRGNFLVVTITFMWIAFAVLGYAWDLSRILYLKTYQRTLATDISLSMVNQCYYIPNSVFNVDAQNVIVMPNPNSPAGVQISKGTIFDIGGTKFKIKGLSVYDIYKTQRFNKEGNPTQEKVHYADKDYLKELLKEQPENLDIIDGTTLGSVNSSEVIQTTNSDFGKDSLDGYAILFDECRVNRTWSELSAEEREPYLYLITSEDYKNGEAFNRYIHGQDQNNGECEIYLVGAVKLYFLHGKVFDFGSSSYIRIRESAISQPRILVYEYGASNPNV